MLRKTIDMMCQPEALEGYFSLVRSVFEGLKLKVKKVCETYLNNLRMKIQLVSLYLCQL